MYSKGLIMVSAIRQLKALGDNKFEVVTGLRTFTFRAEKEGTTSLCFLFLLHFSVICQLLDVFLLLVSLPLSLWPSDSLSLYFLSISPSLLFHLLALNASMAMLFLSPIFRSFYICTSVSPTYFSSCSFNQTCSITDSFFLLLFKYPFVKKWLYVWSKCFAFKANTKISISITLLYIRVKEKRGEW